VLEEEEGEQRRDLGLPGHQIVQQPDQSDRLVGERRLAVGVVPAGEEQVEHGQHAGEPLGQRGAGGHAVRDAGVSDLGFGPGEAAGHGRLGDQERTRDVGGRYPADGAQGQRHAGVEGQRRVAAGEDEPQPVVHDLLLSRRRCRLGGRERG
jgi:hypothetical protein